LTILQVNDNSDEAIELKSLLHKLQQLLLNYLESRLMTGVAPDDSKAAEQILGLRTSAFETGAEVSILSIII